MSKNSLWRLSFLVPLMLFGCCAVAASIFVGVNSHVGQLAADPDEVLELSSEIAVHHLRDEVYWSRVEQEKGRHLVTDEMRAMRKLAIKLRERNGGLLIVLGYGNKHYDDRKHPRSDEAVNAYAKYCQFVADYFRGLGVSYEIWNEWNSEIGVPPGSGAGDTRSYLKLAREAVYSIKRADPSAMVISTGIARGVVDVDWLRSLAELGAFSIFDGIGIHTYIYNKPGWNASMLGRFLESVTNERTPLGDAIRAKGLYITEFGSPIDFDSAESDLRLKDFVREVFAASSIRSVRGIWLYQLRDTVSRSSNPDEHRFGIASVTGNLKPIGPAIRDLAGSIARCGRPNSVSVESGESIRRRCGSDGIWR